MKTSIRTIIIAFALLLLLSCVPARAEPVYRYSACGATLLRAYDGAAGYVRWGRYLPEHYTWTDGPLPLVGHARLLILTGCRVMVRDSEGVLYLDYADETWSLPAVGYTLFAPLTMEDDMTTYTCLACNEIVPPPNAVIVGLDIAGFPARLPQNVVADKGCENRARAIVAKSLEGRGER